MNLSNLEVEINPDYTMMKKVNKTIYLSQEQIDILESYNIDYKSCSSLNEIINQLEMILDETDEDIVSNLLDVLSERNYYENYKK
ncbi:MAG: hypothetical protein J1F35_03105 [Erysipelotrichales bacterium]|nr:hypothetical protein [Erysipelotrichales bacterium]